jgi:hypothetical protein
MSSRHAGRVAAPGRRFGRDRAILLGSLGAVVAAGWTALALWARYRLSLPAYGWEWQFEGRNAIQSDWKMEHVA